MLKLFLTIICIAPLCDVHFVFAKTDQPHNVLFLARMDSVARILADIDAEARSIGFRQSQLKDSLRWLESALEHQNLYVSSLDSQYRILEAERQPLLEILTRSVLTDIRMGKWALVDALLGSGNLKELMGRRAAMRRLRETAKLRASESARILLEIRKLEDLSLDEAKKLSSIKASIDSSYSVYVIREYELNVVRSRAEAERDNLIEQQSRLEKSSDLLKSQLDEKAKAVQRVATIVESQIDQLVSNGTFSSLKGLLPWPVEGSVVSGFGKKRHRRLETVTENPGIDVFADPMVPVRAVAAGTVNTITWLRGFGNVCIVNHEGDHHTVYARLGEIALRQGDVIEVNTIIGYPGFDSEHNSYVVHFEIWNGKEKQDPITWLAPVKK